jgi:c-di-GMP-binding flagellar brake protein YcgR
MNNDQERLAERLPGQRLVLPAVGEQALLLVNSFRDKFKVEILGGSRNSFLIITMPMYRGAMDRLQEGENVGIAFQQSGKLYQFSTSILHQSLKPAPILFLAWPKSATRKELRAATRFPCALPISVSLDGESHPGVIADISLAGLGVIFKTDHRSALRSLLPNTTVTASFSLGDFGEILGALAVRRVEAGQDSVRLGLSLEGLDEMEQETLQGFLGRVSACWEMET